MWVNPHHSCWRAAESCASLAGPKFCQGNVSLSNGASRGIVQAFKAAAVNCPLSAAIDLIGEKWTILILRGSMSGLRHFEEFQASLGIARNILSNRLARLVEGEILERSADDTDRRRIVYTLTDKGRELLPTLVALRQWSEKWVTGVPALILADKLSGKPLRPLVALADDGREVSPDDLTWIDTRLSGEPVARKAGTATAPAISADYS
jgi:DNA-binding HxlR family transcriptional regulator